MAKVIRDPVHDYCPAEVRDELERIAGKVK
jgi:hypothetical protein